MFFFFTLAIKSRCLESEEQQEGHHQTEQTHGLRQGESQDGVGEQLLLQRWVSCVTNDQRTEYCSDTGTCLRGRETKQTLEQIHLFNCSKASEIMQVLTSKRKIMCVNKQKPKKAHAMMRGYVTE